MDRTAITRSAPNKLGKYEVRKLLGKGNMGVVFLAHDPALERDVAIKVMAGASMHNAELKERFEREAKAVARLHHPNIVTIHDLGSDHQGSPFIAMELLEGSDLEHAIESKAGHVVRRLEVVAQVCRGLHHAHSIGIVHRDIKPANIFVTKDGAKIMDFGVARWMKASQTQSGAVLGTACYMSPEQIRGEKVDGRADIFSVGIVLYELLTNKKLFEGDSIETVFFKTLSLESPQLVLPDGRSFPELQTILDTALATDVENRYTNAEDMAAAIHSFLRDHSAELPAKPIFRVRDPNASSEATNAKGSLRTLASQNASTLTPKTAATSAPIAPGTDSRPTPRRSPTAAMRRAPRPVARPRTPSLLPWVAGALTAVVGVATATYFLAFPRSESPTPSVVPIESAETPVDLEKRFLFAEELLENGQVAQAFEAVQNILTIDPNNSRALELQAAIRNLAADRDPEPIQPAPPPVDEPTPIAPSTPTPRERAASFAADAALAVSQGELDRAESLIVRGARLDPENPRWSELRAQIRAKNNEQKQRALASRYVREGQLAIEAGSYQDAIDAYKQAMKYAPENAAAQSGLEQAISLKHQAEAQATAAPTRRFVESKTTFTPSETETEDVVGFQMEERFEVNETADALFPAHIIIELNPPDAKPGEPYVLRVRVFNEGYSPIDVRSLELVSAFGGKTTGAGSQIPTRASHIAPQATALVYEIGGTWKEAQNQGSITATVTLQDGGTFSKTLSW